MDWTGELTWGARLACSAPQSWKRGHFSCPIGTPDNAPAKTRICACNRLFGPLAGPLSPWFIEPCGPMLDQAVPVACASSRLCVGSPQHREAISGRRGEGCSKIAWARCGIATFRPWPSWSVFERRMCWFSRTPETSQRAADFGRFVPKFCPECAQLLAGAPECDRVLAQLDADS